MRVSLGALLPKDVVWCEPFVQPAWDRPVCDDLRNMS